MKITVRCFASVRELLGSEVVEIDVPAGTTVRGLLEILARDAPDLLRLPLAQAVNQDYAVPERELADGDEVAYIPPISGGEPGADRWRFELVHGPLDPRRLESEVRTDRDGAVVTFSGVTRDHNDGRAVAGLSYEAYAEMVQKVFATIVDDAFGSFDISRVRVAHRLGEVPIGEASVLVVVAAEHRGPAFDACRALMDRIKADLPIFKKETLAGPDGGSHWVGELPTAEQ